ncbi:VOC family protein [Lysobacter sp. H23M47]|uniref:VOC family protein n=1 Tax=Lysobacter sp. H23M47 TaxID=2781024 RepID=UPI00187F0418|nr:VOC family protein [Lysobacter sp. H23M47]QOW25208.1 glyoxalase [Lysobacter sp. H23M47]
MPNSTIIPCLQYRNAHVAIDWLCEAFGFERLTVHADERIVHHAQLVLEGGMVMLGSARDELVPGKPVDRWQRRMVQPDQIGGRETQTTSVIVQDPDAHYARAVAAGAEIIRDIADQEYGGRGYGCLDIEGHMWWFASYDPWRSSADAGERASRNVH